MSSEVETEQEARTRAYAKKHKLNELFAHFLQLLVYNKPDDPREFLKEELLMLVEKKTPGLLFTDKDFETMFNLIDVTKQRYVTVSQLRNTCKNLATARGEGSVGLSPEEEEDIESVADEEGHVSMENFTKVLKMQLQTKYIWNE